MKVEAALRCTNKIFFHIKSAEDYNGFHRLVLSGFPHTRQLKLDQFESRVLTEPTSDYDLVILSEIGISGSQTVNALKRYYLSSDLVEETAQKLVDKEKYYPIQLSQHITFKEKMRSFKNIHLFLLVTQRNPVKATRRNMCVIRLSREKYLFPRRAYY
ncbi:hypothetical protein LQK80_33695 [Bacillus thuringiensis]|nr:hypothetical protein [Bacillus thuringiensis]